MLFTVSRLTFHSWNRVSKSFLNSTMVTEGILVGVVTRISDPALLIVIFVFSVE